MTENSNLQPVTTLAMTLREWSVTHAYASYYLDEIEDLDMAAAALVRSRVASAVYVADGNAYWLKGDELQSGPPTLTMREHETRAGINLPDGLKGWAAEGVLKAMLQRFSEKKVVSSLPGPHHEYLRAAMEPAVLIFGKHEVTILPTLKLYKTGVFVISYEVFAPEDVLGIPELIEKYVHLFTRWSDESWVPAAIARIGSATCLLTECAQRKTRKHNAGMVVLMRAAADETAESITVGEHEFALYPAHASLDGFFERVFAGEKVESTDSAIAVRPPKTTAAPTTQPADASAVSPPSALPDAKASVPVPTTPERPQNVASEVDSVSAPRETSEPVELEENALVDAGGGGNEIDGDPQQTQSRVRNPRDAGSSA